MTRKQAWIIEGPANLVSGGDQVRELITTWAKKYGLTGKGECQVGGCRNLGSAGPEDFDSVTLMVPASHEQIQELAATLADAFSTPMYTREAELIGIQVRDMQTMQPTGETTWIDPERAEPVRRRKSPPKRELN